MNVTYMNDELVDRVFRNAIALELETDYWLRTTCMTSLFLWEHPAAVATARKWLDRAVATQTSDGRLCYGGTINVGVLDVADVPSMRNVTATPIVASYFAYPLAMLYERTGEERYLDAAVRQVDAVAASPRTSEGYFLTVYERPEIYVDMVHAVCGVFARLGRLLDRPELVDDAYRQILVAARRLVDPIEKLSRHVWLERPNTFPESSFWARGNGWLICACAELLEEAPEHSNADHVRELLATLLGSIVALQDRSGFLHDTLDDPHSDLEASATLMFAYAAGKAVGLGVVSDDYLEPAVRALDAVGGIVEPDGSIGRIIVPPGGPGCPFGKLAIGQGLFLLAAYHLRDALQLGGVGSRASEVA